MEKLLYAVCMLLSDDDVVVDEDQALHGVSVWRRRGGWCVGASRDRDAIYLRDMHDAEAYLAEMLGYMAERNYEYDFDVDELLSALLENSEFTFSEKQQLAISTAARNGLVILTGGPGTGKTTTVRGILQVFEALGLDTLLAATGRAAKRLFRPDRHGGQDHSPAARAQALRAADVTVFPTGVTNPLECDAVILDEVSMVDITPHAGAHQCAAARCAALLVGDADQLPPVGPATSCAT